jgi:hypothetical protein
MSSLPNDFRDDNAPISSSAIMPIDTSQFELQVEETRASDATPASPVPTDTVEMRVQATGDYKVSWRVGAQRALNQLVYQLHRNRAFQIGWGLLVAACLALIAFTLTVRLDHIDDDLAIVQELEALETRLVTIRSEWSPEEMAALKENVANADTRRVFLDYRSLAVWLQEKSLFAEQLGLDFRYTLGERSTARIDDMYEVPISATINGPTAQTDTYLRALEFLKRVISTPYYVEISKASLEGQGDGARELTTTLRVWVHSSVRAGDGNVQ